MAPLKRTTGVIKAVFTDLLEVFAPAKKSASPAACEEAKAATELRYEIPKNLPVGDIFVFEKNSEAGVLPSVKTKEKETDISPSFSKKLYVGSEIGLRARATPEIEEGNILDILPFGAEIFLRGEDGKWLYAEYGQNKYGWVSSYHITENNPKAGSSDEATEDAEKIFPKFKVGAVNPAGGENTMKVRLLIKDEFGGGREGLPLQSTEYVAYRLQCFGVKIRWPVRTGRNAGRWAEIFKTYNTYPVLEEPKAGSALVFTSGFKTPEVDALGHVAFVEKVYKDGNVRISEANWPPPGKYNERTLAPSEWRDKYKGKFIIFTHTPTSP